MPDIIEKLEKESLELRDLYLDCQGQCSKCFYDGDCELQDKIKQIEKEQNEKI